MDLFSPNNNNKLLKYLDREELSKFESLKKKLTFEKNEYIVQEQETSRDLYIIDKGHVVVNYLDKKGNEKTLADLYENDIFGEITFILPLCRTAYVKAAEHVELSLYPYEKIIKLLKNNMTISAKIFAALTNILAKRIVRTTQKFESK